MTVLRGFAKMNSYPSPFNSALETGIRSLAILVASYPKLLDLQRLVEMDYIVVHSGDIKNGPTSLHTPTPMRAGELLVRRDIITKGLRLMMSRNLILLSPQENGFFYIAGENAAPFLDMLTSAYSKDLINRAQWASERFDSFSKKEIDEWSNQFILSYRGSNNL